MCDYSLHHVANRPAKVEDKLVATKFRNAITGGTAADLRSSATLSSTDGLGLWCI